MMVQRLPNEADKPNRMLLIIFNFENNFIFVKVSISVTCIIILCIIVTMLFCIQCSNIAGRQESLIKIADKDTILISKKKVSIYIFAAPKDQSTEYLIYYNIFQYQVIIQFRLKFKSRLKLLCSLPINFYYVC